MSARVLPFRAPTPASHAGEHQEILERGVWIAPYRIAGCPVLLAIDDAGERIAERVLCLDGDEEAAVRQLEQLLPTPAHESPASRRPRRAPAMRREARAASPTAPPLRVVR